MHVISRSKLRSFWEEHRNAQGALEAWFKEAEDAAWKSFQDIKQGYPTARLVVGNRVIFKIKGNQYRLVVKINYAAGIVFIRFVGTHREYDLIDVKKI